MSKLVLIGTPIGNLGDMSPRGVEAIRSCSRLLCEDTRHTRKLLNHFAISVPVESFHEHSEPAKASKIIDAIVEGEVIGLVSDAGMPVLSDPGFVLVRLARQRGITVEVIPGPFAASVALAGSGIPTLPFTFHGFTPHRSGERRDFYRGIAATAHTAVVYESPERLIESLRDAQQELGDVEVTVAREMTKIHEEFLFGTVSSVLSDLEKRDRIKGEIVIVFAAASAPAQKSVDPEELRGQFERLRAEGMRRNDAVKVLAERYRMRKNDLYRILLDQLD